MMWLLLVFLAPLTWSFPALHFIKPESGFTQIATLDSCTTYQNTTDLTKCNPALFTSQSDQGLRMGLATITDGESVQTGQKLILDPIKEDTLRTIFQNRSFNSWGANSNIELRTSKFHIGYDPLLINADVFVFNPSSPEVAMSLVKSNRLRLSTGTDLIDNEVMKFSVGTTLYYYRMQYYRDSFFLSDLSTTKAGDLIRFKKKNGVAADLGFFLKFNNAFVPKISFLLKNLNSPLQNKETDIIAENQMRSILVYETYSRLGLGYDFKQKWGAINTELNLPFKSVYQQFYSEYVVGSLGYSLSRFSAQAAVAKYQRVFGFNFGSKLASIGIFYGKSRPLGDFSRQTESVGGVRAEISL